MLFPIVGILTAAAAAVGAYGLYWYERLTPEQRSEADNLAVEYARSLYNRGLDQLTSEQFSRVAALVKRNVG